MYCKNCGTYCDDSLNFCPACGTAIVKPAQTQQNYGYDYNNQYAQQMYNAQPQNRNGLGMSIASLVCGIASLVLLYLGTIPGILGLVFSIVAKSKGSKSGMAKAGMIMSIIGLALSLFFVLLIIIIIVEETSTSSYYDYYDYYGYY